MQMKLAERKLWPRTWWRNSGDAVAVWRRRNVKPWRNSKRALRRLISQKCRKTRLSCFSSLSLFRYLISSSNFWFFFSSITCCAASKQAASLKRQLKMVAYRCLFREMCHPCITPQLSEMVEMVLTYLIPNVHAHRTCNLVFVFLKQGIWKVPSARPHTLNFFFFF